MINIFAKALTIIFVLLYIIWSALHVTLLYHELYCSHLLKSIQKQCIHCIHELIIWFHYDNCISNLFSFYICSVCVHE